MGTALADGVRVRTFAPSEEPPRRAILISPGVHYRGPDDPRFERLCRVLAHSGRWVVAPYVGDYMRLRVTEAAVADVAAAARFMLEHPLRGPLAPDVFSISFGSLPAFRLAASELGDQLSTLIVFGGYADWVAAARFALTGHDGERQRDDADPPNLPVLVSNLLPALPDFLPDDPEHARRDAQALCDAWLAYCRNTWGRDDMKRGDAFHAPARTIAESLPEQLRERFLMGCGVVPGARERCEVALARGDWRHADPTEAIRSVRCRVRAFHGVSDDVIPVNQVDAMLKLLPPAADGRAYKTGLYAHTGSRQTMGPLALSRELWTMGHMLRELAG